MALSVVLAAGVMAVAVVVWLGHGADEPAGAGAESSVSSTSSASSEAPSSSAAFRLSGLEDVQVHQGKAATIRCRLSGPPGRRTSLMLTVNDAAGRRVKARRLDAIAGKWLEAAVPIDLEPGEYTYALLLGDGTAGASNKLAGVSSDGAALRVLAPLPPGFPAKKAIAAAADWIGGRDGAVAFAVVDTNGEDAGGYRRHEPFQLASLAKAMLLVASLRRDPTPDGATEAVLTRMITESDNGAAYAIFGQVGARGMCEIAKAAGMEDYEQGTDWIDTRASAADQARFFFHLQSLVPAAGRSLARRLLAGVVPIQRWGIPAAAGPEGWTSYFKGGWLGTDNKLMVQAAWLKKGRRRWALAVMSDRNPTRSYGWDTQKGVAGILLGQQPTPAYLAVVLE